MRIGHEEKSEILKKLRESVIKGDKEAAKKAVEESLSLGVNPLVALNEGLVKGILEVGERFGRLEIFLTELILSAETMQAAIEVLKPKMTAEEISEIKLGKVILGTVEKDIHDIGKNLVGTMLAAGGFEVYDIGTDAPAKKFIEKAEEVEADIIAASTLMTTTRPYQRDIINLLKDMGLRDKYKVMVGGGAVTPEWTEEIGADAWAKDAMEAVEVARKLIG
jgi:trimethylamine corrinoid protein